MEQMEHHNSLFLNTFLDVAAGEERTHRGCRGLVCSQAANPGAADGPQGPQGQSGERLACPAAYGCATIAGGSSHCWNTCLCAQAMEKAAVEESLTVLHRERAALEALRAQLQAKEVRKHTAST